MKVTYTLYNEASGKLGGTVAARNRGGNTVRSLVQPRQPRTYNQSRIRAILSGLAANWKGTLTENNRASWNTLADASGPVDTGMNLYCAANSLLLQAGGTAVSTAPASKTGAFTPPDAASVSVDTAGTVAFDLANTTTDDWAAASGGKLLVYVSEAQPVSRYSQSNAFTYVGAITRGGSAPATGQSLSIAAASGIVLSAAVGKIVYVRLKSVSATGKVSADAIYRVTVTTP